jgi:hypothetical protein
LSLSRKATPLIRSDFRHRGSKIPFNCPSQERPPLLSGQILDTEVVKYHLIVPLKKSHPSYQAKFQIHFELIKYHSIKKKDTPLRIGVFIHCRWGGGEGGGEY